MTSLTINTVARAALVLVAGSVLALSAQAAGRARGAVAVPATTVAAPPVVVTLPAVVSSTPSVAPVILDPVVNCSNGGSTTVSRC